MSGQQPFDPNNVKPPYNEDIWWWGKDNYPASPNQQGTFYQGEYDYGRNNINRMNQWE
jgi:hypothetical protein